MRYERRDFPKKQVSLARKIAMALVLASGAASAGEVRTLTQSDTEAGESFTTPSRWNPAGLPVATDKAAIFGVELRSPSAGGTLNCGVYLDGAGVFYPRGTTVINEGIHLRNKSRINFAYAEPCSLTSALAIDGNGDDTYVVLGSTGEQTISWSGDLTGFRRFCMTSDNKGSSATKTRLVWTGSFSGYSGTILWAATQKPYEVEFPNGATFVTTSFTAKNGVTLRPGAASSFKNLVFQQDSSATGAACQLDPVNGAVVDVEGFAVKATTTYRADLNLPTNGTVRAGLLKFLDGVTLVSRFDGTPASTRHPIEVTGTFDVGSCSQKIGVRLDLLPGVAVGIDDRIDVLKVLSTASGADNLTVDRFQLANGWFRGDSRTGLETVSKMEVVEEDGYRKLVVYPVKTVVKVAAEASCTAYDTLVAENWSDPSLPEGADYHTTLDTAVPRTYGDEAGVVAFPGRSLVVEGGATLFHYQSSKLLVDNLTLYGRCRYWPFAETDEPTVIAGGVVNLLPWTSASGAKYYDVVFKSYISPAGARIDSEVCGDATVVFQHRGVGTLSSSFWFNNLNTNFCGCVRMCTEDWENPSSYSYSGNGTHPFWTNFINVVVSDARNLGVSKPGTSKFVYDQIRMRDYSRLDVIGDATFDDPWRGFFFDDVARIRVAAAKTCAISSKRTFGGYLYKEGPGTLAFGGDAPQYAVGGLTAKTVVTEPVAGTNNLVVMEGAVKPLSVDAFDGLAIAFSNDAQIAVNVDEPSQDLRRYGLRNRWTAPFAWPEGKAIVRFDKADGDWSSFDEATVGVLTVSTHAQAEAACAKLKNAKAADHVRGVFSVRDNDDGTSTVVAHVARFGMAVIIR